MAGTNAGLPRCPVDEQDLRVRAIAFDDGDRLLRPLRMGTQQELER
jgi:hypothetical protein